METGYTRPYLSDPVKYEHLLTVLAQRWHVHDNCTYPSRTECPRNLSSTTRHRTLTASFSRMPSWPARRSTPARSAPPARLSACWCPTTSAVTGRVPRG